jgi:two-component sensor histidine kinase
MDVRKGIMPELGTAAGSIDRLLLDEANHRAANEVTSVLAALRRARSAKERRVRQQMLDLAIDRLQGFGDCSRLMAGMSTAPVNVGLLVAQVCEAVLKSRVGTSLKTVVIDLADVMTDGETAKRLAMIAYELVTNALKHAFQGGGKRLTVHLSKQAGSIVLMVQDDGPGVEAAGTLPSENSQLGSRIVRELVRSSFGSLEWKSEPGGTLVQVVLPHGAIG